MTNNLIPQPPADQSLDGAIKTAIAFGEICQSLDFKEATTHSGKYYSHDAETGQTVISAGGLIVKNGTHTLQITIPKPGATLDGALQETAAFTQKQRAAFVGVEQ